MTLEELRRRLSEVDREVVELIAARQRIVADIGAHKIEHAVPTRDYEREKEVLKGARAQAAELGLDADLAEEVMSLLIRSSLTQQEQTRVAADTSGAGRGAAAVAALRRLDRQRARSRRRRRRDADQGLGKRAERVRRGRPEGRGHGHRVAEDAAARRARTARRGALPCHIDPSD